MNLIPVNDLSEFLLLPSEVRREVTSWNVGLHDISPPIQRALKSLADQMGVASQTARRKYDLWLKSGWRGLINRAKAPEKSRSNLHPDFIEYWRGLCQKNGRKCKPAYREFLRQFKAGEPIPGLDPALGRASLPLGYSYDNLMLYKPTRLELTAARIGRSAAADFRPKVLTSRVGLQVGQRYLFDDLWHDFKVVMVNQRRPMRLLQLHAHDLFSGCQFARGLKPRMEDPDTGKSINLKEDEMLFLLAHVFTTYGFHPDGCTLMLEHGTASANDAVEQSLFDLSNGKITIDRSGIEGVAGFAGQYPGRGKGNFRFKAALESLGNLIHNETANLLQFPGQTGSNSRINCPEELAGREKHTDQLSLALLALPPRVAVQLRLPFLEVNTAKWLVEEILERINQRTDHELQGWLESNLTTVDLALPLSQTGPLIRQTLLSTAQYLALSPEQRAAVDAIATPAPRRLSPREVFDAARGSLVKFRPEQTAALLKDRSSREVIVAKDHLIYIEDQTISPGPLTYLAHHFQPGDKFTAVVNPWSLEQLALFDARGCWVGFVSAWQRPSQSDPVAIAEQMGRAAKVEKELLAPLAARGLDLTRQRLEDSRHNTNVLRAEAATIAESESRARAALTKAAEMF